MIINLLLFNLPSFCHHYPIYLLLQQKKKKKKNVTYKVQIIQAGYGADPSRKHYFQTYLDYKYLFNLYIPYQ